MSSSGSAALLLNGDEDEDIYRPIASNRRKRIVLLVFFAAAVVLTTSIVVPLALSLNPAEGAEQPRQTPVVVNTWWPGPATVAYGLLANQSWSALDAAQAACADAEVQWAYGDHTVGWNGSPDTNGETTLDALLMDGRTMDVAAVAYLRDVRHAIAAARAVMEYTQHTILAGDGARDFANSSLGGLPRETLTGNFSAGEYDSWLGNNCQPNYWAPSALGSNASCGPYRPAPTAAPGPVHGVRPRKAGEVTAVRPHRVKPWATVKSHDTVGVCTLDTARDIAVGVSSNGANHKVA